MKKVLILACGAILFATSCLSGGGSPGNSSADYGGYLTVSEISTGETTYSDDNAKVSVVIPNILEPNFDIVFNKMKFDSAMPVKLDVKFEELPFETTISEDENTLNYVFIAKNDVRVFVVDIRDKSGDFMTFFQKLVPKLLELVRPFCYNKTENRTAFAASYIDMSKYPLACPLVI
jgi:hypothetical protein